MGNVLPRKELREPAFRKYENAIALACKGTVEINPHDYGDPSGLYKPLNPQTFIQRMRDAMRGWRLYKYWSKVIPENADLTRIKLFELDTGMVLCQNSIQDHENKSKPQPMRMLSVDPSDPMNTEKWTLPKVRTGTQTFSDTIRIEDEEKVVEWVKRLKQLSFENLTDYSRVQITFDTPEGEKRIQGLAIEFAAIDGELVIFKDEHQANAYILM